MVDKETKEPLPFAKIKIVDTELVCTTDADGNFEIIAPVHVIQDPFQIKIGIIGYEPVVHQFNKKDLKNGPVNIEMVWKFDMLMGDVVIIKDKKKREKK